MSWEFDKSQQPEEVKDRTKLVWGVVLAAIVVMAALLIITTRPGVAAQSRAYVKHIYIPFERSIPGDRDRALELIADVRQRIISGELSFEEAARNYSAEKKIAQRGGHMGWVDQDDIAPGKAKEFVWEGPVGELSSILESGVGFHLIFVENRKLSAHDQYERELQERVLRGEEAPETDAP